jgi:hypothetical protein
MKNLADLAIALADLLEAEGRLLRLNVVRLKYSFGLGVLSLLLLLIGLGLLLFALYQSLLAPLGPAFSALITGLACVACAVLLQWIDRKITR